MSRENVEAFKRFADANNRRDVEALLAELDPDVEWQSAVLGSLGGEATMHRGHDGVREMLRDLYEAFSEFRVEFSDIRDLGDRVVATGRWITRGEESGVETTPPLASVVDFKNGKAIRVRSYLDHEEALEAAGLSESAVSKENVEVVRAVYDAWNAGDMTALRDLCDPDVVMHHPEGWPEPGPSVGREAVMRQWEQIRDAWTGDTLEPVTDFIAAADRVVVRDAWRGSGQGPDAAMEFTRVFTLRERKIIVVDIFWDHAEALEAVGLRE